MKRLDLKNPKDRIKFILACIVLFGPFIVIWILDANSFNEMIHDSLTGLGALLLAGAIGAIGGLIEVGIEYEERKNEKIRMKKRMQMYNELKEELREEIKEEFKDHDSNK